MTRSRTVRLRGTAVLPRHLQQAIDMQRLDQNGDVAGRPDLSDGHPPENDNRHSFKPFPAPCLRYQIEARHPGQAEIRDEHTRRHVGVVQPAKGAFPVTERYDGEATGVEQYAQYFSRALVMDRTGHTTSAMLNRCRLAARSFAELGQGDMVPLDEGLPEFRPRHLPRW
jgi:hypothetical protein